MYDIQSQLPQDLLQFIAGDSHLLQMTIDTLPVPIFYKDVQGIYLGCNKAFEDFIKCNSVGINCGWLFISCFISFISIRLGRGKEM
ncbi:hypothetical protein TUM3794_00010 [Shewanella colwelliana]|uniref:PAS domain-containing protein n=1 Tax=Shewanella colwelliana TaxID=23 RepID=A0ABQ4NTQ2_SHECO|nr:hypothetical protein [Shewanella colwelliana]GIU34143.1 hypothetical protein TUM3794_00010 [Shewanella colwelliana]